MTRISRYKLSKQQSQDIEGHLVFLIGSLRNQKEIEHFLDNFLTQEEKIMMTKRLALFMMLERNYSPIAIQQALRISYETVRTYQNQFRLQTEQFRKIIRKVVYRQEAKEFFQKVEKLLKPLGLALQAKTNMQARAKLASGDWE